MLLLARRPFKAITIVAGIQSDRPDMADKLSHFGMLKKDVRVVGMIGETNVGSWWRLELPIPKYIQAFRHGQRLARIKHRLRHSQCSKAFGSAPAVRELVVEEMVGCEWMTVRCGKHGLCILGGCSPALLLPKFDIAISVLSISTCLNLHSTLKVCRQN